MKGERIITAGIISIVIFILISTCTFGLCLSLFLIEYRSVFSKDLKDRKKARVIYGRNWKLCLAATILSGILSGISISTLFGVLQIK